MGFRQIASWILALVCAFAVWEVLASQFVRRAQPLTPLGDTSARIRKGLIVASDEGFGRVEFSKDGYRMPTPPSDLKPKVLVLGDSYAEALQVGPGRDLASVMMASLEERGIKAGVWNAGASGRSPAHYLALSAHYQKTLSPDLVVIQLNASDFNEDLDRLAEGFGFEAEGDGWKLLTPKAPPGSSTVDLLMRSSVLYITGTRMKGGGGGHGAPKKKSQEEIDREKREKAAKIERFAVWLVPQLAAAYPSLAITYIPSYDYFANGGEPAPEEAALEQACSAAGVPFINGRGIFRKSFEETGEPSHGFSNTTPGAGHINATGHRLLGQELAEVLGSVIETK